MKNICLIDINYVDDCTWYKEKFSGD
jgi:dynein heavy chain